MGLPDCYENSEAVLPFFEKAKKCLPFLAFEPIQRAYAEEDKRFKCVAIAHMKNYFKKAAISENDFKELLSLLDTFCDPYQDFVEQRSSWAWENIKKNLLGGLI
jgi:hypothetical protein